MQELSPAERASSVERRLAQWERLRHLVALAWERSAFYRRRWEAAGLPGPEALTGLQDLPRLGSVTREELAWDQQAHPPWGSVLTVPPQRLLAVHRAGADGEMPFFWYDDAESWQWVQGLWDYAFRAAGVRPGERALFACGFGPVSWYWAGLERAQQLGLMVISGAAMSPAQRLQNLVDLQVTLLVGSPDELLELARAAAEGASPVWKGCLRRILYACGPGTDPAETGHRLAAAWRAEALAVWWMAEAGLVAFECQCGTGRLHLLESELYAEVIDPETQEPLPPGGEGELVVTAFGRTAMPLIRLRTGERVALDDTPCCCGRSFRLLRGGIREPRGRGGP